jgi:hypothetical protein
LNYRGTGNTTLHREETGREGNNRQADKCMPTDVPRCFGPTK